MGVVGVLSAVLLVAGTVFLLAAALGVLRFPDFYSRLHAAGKGDTLGQALILLGLILVSGLSLVSLKLAMIAFFVLLLNPTATHALARGAWVCMMRPLTGTPPPRFDQFEGDLDVPEQERLLADGRRRVDALGQAAGAEAEADEAASGDEAGGTQEGPAGPGEAPWTT